MVPRKTFTLPVVVLISLACFLPAEPAAAAEDPPNIILFLVDDLGWTDLGCYGSTYYETPNIDALRAAGVKFTNAYAAAPNCGPSRASLLTGKYPVRLPMTGNSNPYADRKLTGPNTELRLVKTEKTRPLETHEVTIAEVLHDVPAQPDRYKTCYVGKWHVSDDGVVPSQLPDNQGFDFNIGGSGNGSPAGGYTRPSTGWDVNGYYNLEYPEVKYNGQWFPLTNLGEIEGDPDSCGADESALVSLLGGGNCEDKFTGEAYLTDALTYRAIEFLNFTSEPFFLYLSHHAPHTPIDARDGEADNLYKDEQGEYIEDPKGRHGNREYGAMIKAVDDSLGAIRKMLEIKAAQGEIVNDTVIVFASDNGGHLGAESEQWRKVTSNEPLRTGKATLHEGGIRVPLIVHWPGRTRPGATCDVPVVLTDLFSTFTEIAGITFGEVEGHFASDPDNDFVASTIDGVSLVPLLTGQGRFARPNNSLFWHHPHYNGQGQTPNAAVRRGDFKLIKFFEYEGDSPPHLGDTEVHPNDPAQFKLYNLKTDIGETDNLYTETAGDPYYNESLILKALLENWLQTMQDVTVDEVGSNIDIMPDYNTSYNHSDKFPGFLVQ